jgi:hypothetical protein
MRFFKTLISTSIGVFVLIFASVEPVMNDHSNFVTTGTAIAIIARDNQIAVAADSKIKVGRNLDSSSDCKIKQSENAFFAIAGHRRAEHSEFDAFRVVREVFRMSNEARERTGKFEMLCQAALYNMVWTTYRKDRHYFDTYLRNKTILQVAFFGFQSGSPYLYVRHFKATESPSGRIAVEIKRQECTARCDMLVLLGKSSAVGQYITQTPNSLKEKPINLVRKFVELEIIAEPDIVGPPIDILLITKGGAEWKQRKMECQYPGSW